MEISNILSIIAICISCLPFIYTIIKDILKHHYAKISDREIEFKEKINYIWRNNYKTYYNTIYSYYDEKNLFKSNKYNLKNNSPRKKYLIPVDDVTMSLNPGVNKSDLKYLNEITVKYTTKNNLDNSSIIINNSKFPNKKGSFLENYLDICNIELHGNASYFLNSFSNKDQIFYEVYEDSYNKYIESGLYLEYDLSNFKLTRENLILENSIKNINKLTLRDKVDLLNFKNRYVGIGVCTLTVFKNVYNRKSKNNTDAYFLIQTRSNNLVEHPSQKSIIPAGTFEPNSEEYEKTENLNFSNTVY